MAYSARQAADLLGLPVRRVRAWVEAGILDPSRSEASTDASDDDPVFGFRDLVLLRTAAALVEQRISPLRVQAALARLRSELPADQPLSAVPLRALGASLVVQDGARWWDLESGQGVFGFETSADASPVTIDPPPRPVEAIMVGVKDGMCAEDWFELGLDLESLSPAQGRDAYRHCLELDPEHIGARINLGRLLMEDGVLAAAIGHFRVAHLLAPQDALSAYNLALALEASGQPEDARALLEETIRRDGLFEDAYVALAHLQERLGDQQGALRTLGALRRLRGD
jgi:tetratricopeptide (TPR) repeat protein